ncbi:MAG: hypothetical protein H7281_05420 [Bacteriovorax sp.]|nr:hypothetical protein [Bacteriovorax sp.]
MEIESIRIKLISIASLLSNEGSQEDALEELVKLVEELETTNDCKL